MASLDRLASRQRILEQNGGSGIATLTEKSHENGGGVGVNGGGGGEGRGGGGAQSNGSSPYSVSNSTGVPMLPQSIGRRHDAVLVLCVVLCCESLSRF